MINLKLAWLNIKAKKFKYVIIFLLIMITSIGIYTSNLLATSLSDGLEKTKEKLGADLIIVPSELEKNVEDALFEGIPCTLTFDSSFNEKLTVLKGVDKFCSQLYIATLSGADCCDNSTQLIAFDIENDFVIGPWISENISTLKDDEIVLGASHALEVGDSATYYNKTFTVVAILEQTGLGYDDSAFITYDAAQEIVSNNLDKFDFSDVNSVTSMTFVDTTDDYSPQLLEKVINGQYGHLGIAPYSTNSKITSITKDVSNFKTFGNVMNMMIILLTTISLFALITITTFQRKNEIGSMLTIGTPKTRIILIFILEYLIVSTIAIVISLIGIETVFLLFKTKIDMLFNLPFVLPSVKEIILLILKLIGINLFIMISSITFPFYWIHKKSPAEMIKEVGA